MNRTLYALTAAVILLILTALPVSAYDPDALLGDVSDYLPDELTDTLPFLDKSGLSEEAVTDALDFGSVLKWAATLLLKALKAALAPFCMILGTAALGTVFSALRTSFASEALSSAMGYVMTLCTSLTVYEALGGLWEEASAQLEKLTALMNSMLPVMTSLYAAGGNVTSAAVNNSAMMTVLALLENILGQGLSEILKLCFVFSLMSGLCIGTDLGGVGEMIRNAYTTALTFIMMLLSTVMAYQNRLSYAADSVAARTVKFAAGNLIPVIGGAVGEATRALGGSISLLRSTVGILGAAAVAALILPTVINLIINKSALNLAGVIIRALGCENESRVISASAGIINLSLALVAAVSVFFMFALTLFIKTGAAVG